MALHTINLSEKAQLKYKENFGNGKWGFNQFSKWISEKLEKIDVEVLNGEVLLKRKEELIINSEKIKKELKELELKILKAKKEEKERLTFSKEEKVLLEKCKKTIEKGEKYFLPNLRSFNDKTGRDLNVDEFKKALKGGQRPPNKLGGLNREI